MNDKIGSAGIFGASLLWYCSQRNTNTPNQYITFQLDLRLSTNSHNIINIQVPLDVLTQTVENFLFSTSNPHGLYQLLQTMLNNTNINSNARDGLVQLTTNWSFIRFRLRIASLDWNHRETRVTNIQGGNNCPV